MFKILLVVVCLTGALPRGNTVPINEELLAWEPPADMQDDFPYYLASVTDGSPLFVMPFGEYPLNEWVKKDRDSLGKYFAQMFTRFAKGGREGNKYYLIMDLEGFEPSKNGDPGFISEVMGSIPKWVDDSDFAQGWILNGDKIFEQYWNMGKDSSGPTSARIQFYLEGNTDWWEPLSSAIPIENIPYAYGGDLQYEDFEDTFG